MAYSTKKPEKGTRKKMTTAVTEIPRIPNYQKHPLQMRGAVSESDEDEQASNIPKHNGGARPKDPMKTTSVKKEKTGRKKKSDIEVKQEDDVEAEEDTPKPRRQNTQKENSLSGALNKSSAAYFPAFRPHPLQELNSGSELDELGTSSENGKRGSGASPEQRKETATNLVVKERNAKTKRCSPGRCSSVPSELRLRLKKLVRPMEEITFASDIANKIQAVVEDHIRTENFLSGRAAVYNCGSYYDKTQIRSVNEFDKLYVFSVNGTELDVCPANIPDYYCRVKVVATKCCDIPAEMVCKDRRFLSPKGFKNRFKNEVQGALVTRVTRQNKDLMDSTKLRIGKIKFIDEGTSPAVTLSCRNGGLSLDFVPALEFKSWPECSKDWDSKWLTKDEVSKCKSKVFVVAKPHFTEFDKPETDCVLWRFGFNHAEKCIFKDFACRALKDEQGESCRKHVMKLVKEDMGGAIKKHKMHEMCTYFVKTTMMHVYDEKPDDSSWLKSLLPDRYLDALDFLLKALKNEYLEHYFIPGANLLEKALFSNRGLKDIRNLQKELQSKRDRYFDHGLMK